MNNSRRFCSIRCSGTIFSSRASETPNKSLRVPRRFSRAVSHLVTRGWAEGTGKKPEMGSSPTRLALDKPYEARKSPGALKKLLQKWFPHHQQVGLDAV